MKLSWVLSPNFDTNRKKIDRIVIHWMVGTLAAADAVFKKTTPGTSAHYGIEDDIVHQYVKEENVAYHAGVYTMNQRSIGIEHSADPNRPATNSTYSTSAQIVADVCKRYGIPLDREHILGHNQVKATQCPGTMDIDRIIREAKALNEIPSGAQSKEQIIIDVYMALTGVGPTEAEKKWRIEQDLNTVQLIEDICTGDTRFYTKWISPWVKTYLTKIDQLEKVIEAPKFETPPLTPPTPPKPPANTGTGTKPSNSFWDFLRHIFKPS